MGKKITKKSPKKGSNKGNGKGKSKYEMMAEIPHILHRPDTYIGTVQEEEVKQWIFSDKEGKLISFEKINYIQGFYKLYDEILVNAYDHTVEDATCSEIRININREEGIISVWNNGRGIPITKHKEHKMYIPTMLFGNLRSSSNYDDNVKRVTGGRNGLGSKLVNICSTKFTVETVDTKRKKKFKQIWTDHMQQTDGPVIKDFTGESYTSFTFHPDYKIFKIKGISKDIFNLMKKRAFDMAMTTNDRVSVYFNDKKIKHKSFTKYIGCYFPDNEFELVIDDKQKRWKVAMVYDRNNILDHKNISFVNGICTYRGGKHVNHVVDQIIDKIILKIKGKVKSQNLTPEIVKKSVIFFINCQIENPTFDTQTKEHMTLKVKDFGSEFKVTDAFIKKIVDTGIIEDIIERLKHSDMAMISKIGGKKTDRITGIPKLDDAHDAGTKKSNLCTLILTEGDSAKALAIAGLAIVGRTHFGVFPLRGKVLNVRKSSAKQILENAEIQAIFKIVGLDPRKDYKSGIDSLRYGRIMVMADQDLDGFHIKGLIMNIFDHFFPNILKENPGFIQSLVTPIVKCTKGKKVLSFYNLNEFKQWYEEEGQTGWKFKYYKGLGTSDSTEAREYFKKMDECLINYFCKKTKKNVDPTRYAMDLAFRNEKNKEGTKDTDRRKEWLKKYDPDVYIERSQKDVSYDEYINKELIQFSHADNIRSIPSLLDGMKPSNRKIIYAALKKKLFNEMKVTPFAGYVVEHAEYHHGEVSLHESIVGMAQNYVGSNNIPMMEGKGMFGTRILNGKDHAAPRYLMTNLSPLVKSIINPLDAAILKYIVDDGKPIEPYYYLPVLCMMLINNVEGIGTGYSTGIPSCNPIDILYNTRRIIKGKEPKPMLPWYRNFLGQIDEIDKNRYMCYGNWERIDDVTIRVTELPIGMSIEGFTAHLENLMHPDDEKLTGKKLHEKKAKVKKGSKKGAKGKVSEKKSEKKASEKQKKDNIIIKDYKPFSSEVRIDFVIKFKEGYLKKADDDTIDTLLKLKSAINATNMYAFNDNHEITKYDSFGHILKDFAEVRLKYYQIRKDYLLGKYKQEKKLLNWKMKFVEYVLEGKVVVFDRKGKSRSKSDVHDQLREYGFPEFIEGEEEVVEEDGKEKKKKKKEPYQYTRIGLYNLTHEEVEKLRKLLEEKIEEIRILKSKTNGDLWSEELDIFEAEYLKWDAEQKAIHDELMKDGTGKRKGSKKSRSKKVTE